MKFRHFPLHPETPEEGMTLEELFRGRNIDIPAAQQQMKARMQKEGLPYGDRSMTYNSRRAQELAIWAEQHPGGDQIHDALFRAYFVEGINVARSEHLLAIVEQIGLPVDAARDVLESRRCGNLVDADWNRARQLGLTGVPTFIVGDQGVAGAQPYEVLERLVVSGGARKKEA